MSESKAQHKEILIRLRDGELPLFQKIENGNVTEYPVLLEQLAVAISEYVANTTLLESPILPAGTVKFIKTTTVEIVILQVDPVTVNVRYQNALFENVHFPKLLFAFPVNGNRVGKCYTVAVTDFEVHDNTLIYRYPYSNVYGGTNVCWYELPITIESYTELSRIPYRWFGSENSGNLFGPNVSNASKLNLREYLEHNSKAKRDSFDSTTLLPTGLTFNMWVDLLIKSS